MKPGIPSYFFLLILSLPVAFAVEECPLINEPEIVGPALESANRLLRGNSIRNCNVDELLNCSLFEGSSEPFISTGSGDSIPNLTQYSGPVTERDLTPADLRKMRETFTYVKEAMKQEILRGREPTALNEFERSLYVRVDTIKLDKGFQPCRSSRPNAQYIPNRHTLMLCPGFLKMPAAALVKVMAHEVSHSIDYCNMLTGFYERTNVPSTSPLAGEEQYFVHSARLERLSYPQTAVSAALSTGQIRRVDGGGPGESYPLARNLSCLDQLKNPNSSNYVTPTLEQCSIEQTTAGEDSAELWSSKILGRYLAEHPFKSELEKQSLLFEAVGSKCQTAPTPSGKKMNVGAEGAHSADDFRLNQIFLTNPEIQQAMGCRPVEKACLPN